jgi:putative ABC transport system permease protein
MFRNYLLIALRNLKRYKSFSILNVLGLTIGIISFMIILLYIQHELSYNKHISNLDNKYRVVEIQTQPGIGDQHVAVTMGPLGPALANDFPEVKQTLRIMGRSGVPIKYGDEIFIEDYLAYADSTVFDMLNVKLIQGNEKTALQKMESIILSESLARKFFGNQDPMGKILDVNGTSFLVTGIMQDYPEKSSIYFKALMPFKLAESRNAYLRNWHSNSLDTYVELQEGTGQTNFEKHFSSFLRNYFGEDWEENIQMYLQPVSDIHLKSNHIKFQSYNHHQGDIKQVYIFSIIAVLILIVACINYINLSTSMALKRSKEVGVRKVVGAGRKILILQLLGESYTIVMLSALLALAGISLVLPLINNILGISLLPDFSNPVFSLGILITILIVGLFSGLYPALYTSRFKPTVIFRGFRTADGKNRSGQLRRILVVTQFSVSIIIIISTIVVLSQVSFFRKADKGYNAEAVYYIPMNFSGDERIDKINLLKKELKKSPMVRSVAASSYYNGVAGNQSRITVADTSEQQLMVRFGFVDPDYFPLMEIEFMAGRNFSENFSTDPDASIILNEIAVKKLGWKEPVGKRFTHPFNDSLELTVIGVIKDYNYYSLRSPIEPAAYYYNENWFGCLVAKIDANNLSPGVEKIKTTFNELFPGTPFNGYFVSDVFERRYADEINTSKIFGIFAGLCIFISCLGLFGLISFVITQKYKEIAIRKVFGSNIKQIVTVVSKDFLILVLIASAIGTPVAYFYMDNWLNNFAYKISLSWYYFAVAVVLALLIAFSTIIYKAVSAANANPAEALRNE